MNDLNIIDKHTTSVTPEQTMVSNFDMFRIQGATITNIESVLRCNEHDWNKDSDHKGDLGDKYLHNNVTDNNDMSVDEISSNEFDSDDSVKDPDWKLETYRKRNKCTHLSDYDSDISIPDKPDISSKRM